MHKIKIFYFIRFKPDSKDRVGEAGYQTKGIAIHRKEGSFRGRKIFVRKEAFK